MSIPQALEGQQPNAIDGLSTQAVLAHPSKLTCTVQRQYMASKTPLNNPRRKASFFRGHFKALLGLPCHTGVT